jgi:hydroxymethylglutaryl-CoA lyase
MEAITSQAKAWGMTVRAGVQTAFGCVYEGEIEPGKVVHLAKRFLAMGVDELSLADSAGMGNPNQIRRIVQEIVPLAGNTPIAMHLHDTRGMGLANALAALKSGATMFDSSLGGLGGCPFIKGATGNIATEDTVNMMAEMGVDTGVDAKQVAQISRDLADFLDVPLPSNMVALWQKQSSI